MFGEQVVLLHCYWFKENSLTRFNCHILSFTSPEIARARHAIHAGRAGCTSDLCNQSRTYASRCLPPCLALAFHDRWSFAIYIGSCPIASLDSYSAMSSSIFPASWRFTSMCCANFGFSFMSFQKFFSIISISASSSSYFLVDPSPWSLDVARERKMRCFLLEWLSVLVQELVRFAWYSRWFNAQAVLVGGGLNGYDKWIIFRRDCQRCFSWNFCRKSEVQKMRMKEEN